MNNILEQPIGGSEGLEKVWRNEARIAVRNIIEAKVNESHQLDY